MTFILSGFADEISPSLDEQTFAFTPPPNAQRIEFEARETKHPGPCAIAA